MTNIWDSIPASAWPTQVTPWLPFDPMQSAPWPRQTAPSWDASAPRRFGWLHTSAVPMRAQPEANRNDSNAISGSFSAADIPDPAYTARQLEDHDTVLGPPHDASPFGTILRALFGGARDSSSSSAAQPSPQYGVVPKNFPPEYRLPAAVSDWQRPESEFTFPLDSPHTLALIKKWLAAGLPPDRIVLDDTTARLRRDNARMADLLFPGSGNFVSGDWNNINEGDVANLLFSVASTILPPGRAAGPARTAVRGVRAAAEAEAAARAATSIGPVVGNRVLAGERLVTFPEATRLILYDEGAKMLQQLDARNRLLRIPTSSDWVPSLGDIDRLNNEIKAVREQQGLRDLERHHEFVRQYQDWFRTRGIEPEDYITYMWSKYHRLKGGIHGAPYPWNPEWGAFIRRRREPSPDQIHQQLYQMLMRRRER